MRIVLDAMGSDNYPAPEVQAAVEAAVEFGDEILLVGQKDLLEPMLKEMNVNNAPVKIIHAPEVFKMTDKLTKNTLQKEENSMGVGMNMLANGEADAFVTVGNTGGAMAIGLARLKRIKGVKRPALTVVLPVENGQCVVSDIGANADCKPKFLLQFAIMSSVYSQKVLNIKNPRVGLLSNGEEETKGNELVKDTYPLLAKSKLNFIGNVEGKELFGGEADVVITDGFTGNVLVKASEALAKLLFDTLRTKLKSSPIRMLGASLSKSAFVELKEMLDPDEVGAVPLLGLNGLVFVGHGRSNSKAIVSAIRNARIAVEKNLMASLRESIAEQL
ncbi:MAG: phosphate acyltransferase PlsX [Chloroflexi bacterium]|jgi:phosphate acyltransferase|nr:phosphate acyltransferase PlsX [Chloroflexota bacterium]MBT3669394.1 phosphate acyltransferase PlsX [Chloroflexota bacterium]MBT4003288.1 phosphate acyltransferase PlsX [Chloroflexota bacterium]MBT4304587.1 phosphate acyltransferase PlsX [Chloroflexota bacterium]MBT4534072.1 phosphate acyltransferase PlsX [Chloroflexota bacterium]